MVSKIKQVTESNLKGLQNFQFIVYQLANKKPVRGLHGFQTPLVAIVGDAYKGDIGVGFLNGA